MVVKPKYFKKIVFMLAGPHSGYSLDEIFKMKKEEENTCARFFWGYSGTLCYPPRVIHFVRQQSLWWREKPILILAYTPSQYSSEIGRAKEYSVDRQTWQPLPERVLLTGCKYAIIGKNLQRVDFTIDLNKYRVVLGGKIGKPLGEYIRYHINKACATLSTDDLLLRRRKKIFYIAEIVSPYCVFVR